MSAHACRMLMRTAKDNGLEMSIIEAVENVNAKQKRLMFEKIESHYGGDLAGKHFALWGLAFKPKTDDMREAPSIVISEALVAAGATVTAFDPEAVEEAKRYIGDKISYATDALEALDGADALILITEWNEFRHVDPAEIKSRLKEPIIFDGRNIWNPANMRDHGFVYYGIGTR